MGMLDNFLNGKPTTLGLSSPTPILDAALKEAADVPQVDSNTVTGGIVDDNGNLGAQVTADEKLGGNFDAVEQGQWSQTSGWKIGAWIRGSWGKK